jgi:hypothetical protein
MPDATDPHSMGGQSDRDGNGRFRPGHSLPGPGNPNLRAMNKHRQELLASVKDGDIGKAIRFMVTVIEDQNARTSDRLTAARMLLDRLLGVPAATDVLERIERLEEMMNGEAVNQ